MSPHRGVGRKTSYCRAWHMYVSVYLSYVHTEDLQTHLKKEMVEFEISRKFTYINKTDSEIVVNEEENRWRFEDHG